MPVARVKTPDGRIMRINVPEGATPQEIQSMAAQMDRRPSEPAQINVRWPPSVSRLTLGGPLPEKRLPDPGAQIPEVISPGVRETPRADTPLQAAQAATAGEVKRMGLGAKSIWDLALGQALERAKAKRDIGKIEQEQRERAETFPVASFVGQAAPYMAIPQAAVSTPLRAAGTGGGIGWLGSGGEPIATGFGALGGLGGQMASAGLGRMLSRAGSEQTPFQQRAIQDFRAMGGRITPAQETGTRGLQIIESAMESSPMMAGALAKMTGKNQSVANRAAAEAIGETGDVIDDVVMGRARQRLGNEFNAAAREVDMAVVDDAFLDRLSNVQASTTGTVIRTPEAAGRVRDVIDNIIDQAEDGALTGQQIQQYSQEARKAAFRASSKADPDHNLSEAYSGIAEAMDDLLLRNAPSEDLAQRITTMREQYRALKLIQNPGVVRQGNLNPQVLSNVLRRKAPTEYQLAGRVGTEAPMDKLFATGRFGEAVAHPFGRSGTAERQSIGQMAPYVGTGLAGTLMTGDIKPLLAGAAAYGAPWGFSRLYNRYPAVTGLAGLPHATVPLMGGIGGRLGAGLGPQIEPPQ